MAYIVAYLPLTQGVKNSKLIEKIKTYDSWAILSAFVFIVTTKDNVNPADVREDLTLSLRNGDKLFVAELSGRAAWRALDVNMSEWLKKNLSK